MYDSFRAWRGFLIHLLCLFCLCLVVASCGSSSKRDALEEFFRLHQQQSQALPESRPGSRPRRSAVGMVNFGSSSQRWLQKLQTLNRTRRGQFHIVLLGDSHTAGSYFGDALRSTLQGRLGNAGLGWVQPNYVHGQRVALVSYGGSGWKTHTSRTESGDFPVGGIMTRGRGNLVIAPKAGSQSVTLKLIARRSNGEDPLIIQDSAGQQRTLPQDLMASAFGWLHLEEHWMKPPLTVIDPAGSWTLGPVGLEDASGRSGVTVSAFGINGAQVSENGKWRHGRPEDLAAMQADLVILEYGTNEAYNKRKVDIPQLVAQWDRLIRQIKRALPGAGILVVGAPESLQHVKDQTCSRPLHLSEVQAMQEAVARRHRALYWSWQDAMGGECSMREWMAEGLAIHDGVHFDKSGYREAGSLLALAILGLAR